MSLERMGSISLTAFLSSASVQNSASDVSNDASTAATPLTEAEMIEQRRKRREAIKAKHMTPSNQATPLLVQVLDPSKTVTPAETQPATPGSPSQGVGMFVAQCKGD